MLRLGSLAAACLLLASLHGKPCQNVRAGLLATDGASVAIDRWMGCGCPSASFRVMGHSVCGARRAVRPGRSKHVDLRQPEARDMAAAAARADASCNG